EKGWLRIGSSRQRWWCAAARARKAGSPPANSNIDGRATVLFSPIQAAVGTPFRLARGQSAGALAFARRRLRDEALFFLLEVDAGGRARLRLETSERSAPPAWRGRRGSSGRPAIRAPRSRRPRPAGR